MDNYIRFEKISLLDNVVNIEFSTSSNLDKYFNYKKFTYTCESSNLLPESIAVIPFICNVLPIVWLTDSVLYIREIDAIFLNSIEQFKKGYIKMYPQLEFKGNINHEKVIKNYYENKRNLVLFSGGVDAICTLLRHKDENLDLLTLWGSADFPIDDERGWNINWKQINDNASKLGLNCHFMKTNFCDFIPIWGKELKNLISPAKAEWWHDLQHGIGILGHTAPYAFIHKIGIVYIASSFDVSRTQYTCASDPTIDNYVKFGSTIVSHDGYEWNRQEKMHYILDTIDKLDINVKFHVCLRQYQQGNCCHCEKCYRTILSILAEGKNPNNYGFNVSHDIERQIFNDLRHKIYLNHNKVITYKQIQKAVLNNKNLKDQYLIKNFHEIDFDKINNDFKKYIYIYSLKSKYVLSKIYRRFCNHN